MGGLRRTYSAHVQELELRCCFLNGKGFQQLAESPWPRLKVLDLTHSGFKQFHIEVLCTMDLPVLNKLVLSDNSDMDDSTMELLAASTWPSLQLLELEYMRISAVGLTALRDAVTAGRFPQLRQLSLSFTRFHCMADATRHPRYIDISNTAITGLLDAIRHLGIDIPQRRALDSGVHWSL